MPFNFVAQVVTVAKATMSKKHKESLLVVTQVQAFPLDLVKRHT